MQFVDRHTNPSRLNDDVQPLIEAILHNRRIFNAEQDNPPFVTEALKYRRERQKRRQTSPYEGDDVFVDSIIQLFGFDPLDFQVESWQTVEELDTARRESGRSKVAIFSAPTGFGKTEAFLGPIYQLLREGRQDSTAIVYPSRALLQDQLGRIIKHIHQINTTTDDRLSVGVYVGGMPYKMQDVETHSKFFKTGGGRPRFKLANCWCGEEGDPNAFEYHGTSQSYTLRCEADSDHEFTDRELLLSRHDMVFNNRPDILLTTLESLEGFALKPHYPLVDNLDTIVLDEVHMNTQIRGAHASKIIKNVNEITEQPILWLGSSATIDNADRFGRRLFDVSSTDIRTVAPGASDFDDTHDDHEHYYFMLANPDGPGASSMSIQQHLLFGHSLLEQSSGERGKMLAFIDSISQVNQKYTQLLDADHDRELWRYHLGTDDVENWAAVADAMDHHFLDEHLNFVPVFAERGFDSAEVGNSDVLLSTSFLEVGIDVGEIKTITQYRTPWDLSSFKQRAGRAARKDGMDAHIAVMLSSLTGDANMFYRADRFLDSDIRTPLKTDNGVVEWIHERFRDYYEIALDIEDRPRLQLQDPGEIFLEEYLDDQLGFTAYHDLLLNPAMFFANEFGIDVAPEPLLSEALVSEAQAALDQHLNGLRESFADVESFFGLDDGNVVRGEDAVGTYVRRVQERVLKLINAFSGQVTGYTNRLDSLDKAGYEADIAALKSDIDLLRERAAEIPDGSAQKKVRHFDDLLAELFSLTGPLMQLRGEVDRATKEPIPPVRTDRLNDVHDAVVRLNTLSDDDRIKEYYHTQKRIYYLNEALDEVSAYVDFKNPHLSLYAVKHLLRGAYYFDRYLQVAGDTLGEVWYVPPNYYGDAGQFVSVINPDGYDKTDESIDKLVSTYTPYRSEYHADTNSMYAFLPHTRVTEDGVEFDYSEHVSGQVHEGILVPDSIELSSMADLSDSALNIVRYCPECYQIITDLDRCLRHEKAELGKIHSNPQVSTDIEVHNATDQMSSVILADVTSEVTLDGVTLSIRPASSWGSDVTFDSRDPFEVGIDSPDEKLGFQLDTRSLVFDVSTFLETVRDEEVRALVERYHDFEEVDYEYVAYHTAAHFFLQVVSDVSAVNTSMLFYGFNQDEEEVYVFERTEGGQGVVDLVFNDIANDPGTVLEAINRIGYNAQVVNERLWSTDSFVTGLPEDTTDDDEVQMLVADALETPFKSVAERVTQEVLSSMDKAVQFATDEDISIAEAYQVKHALAQEQVAGVDEFPTDAVEALGLELSDVERAETVFFSPDIDGCVENLHLGECIAVADQSDSLSYILLEALRESLTETVPSDQTSTEMFDRELPPAGEFDAESVFLTF